MSRDGSGDGGCGSGDGDVICGRDSCGGPGLGSGGDGIGLGGGFGSDGGDGGDAERPSNTATCETVTSSPQLSICVLMPSPTSFHPGHVPPCSQSRWASLQ